MLTTAQTVYSADSCRTLFALESKTPTQKVSSLEVIEFVQTSGILPDSEMAQALLLKVVDRIGYNHGLAQDAVYNRFYRELFLSYLNQFEKRVSEVNSKKPHIVKPLFGLDQIFTHLHLDSSMAWSHQTTTSYLHFVRQIFEKTISTDLRLASHLLIQMNYVQARISEDYRAYSLSAEEASADYLEMIKAGHTFLPAPKNWHPANMAAQWFSNTTVNLIASDFGQGTIHGGISSFESMIHDQKHTSERNFILPSTSSQKAFDRIVSKALREIEINSLAVNDLTNGLFVFFHESFALKKFLRMIKSGQTDWVVDSKNTNEIVETIRMLIVNNSASVETMSQPTTQFQQVMKNFISTLGKLAVESKLEKEL